MSNEELRKEYVRLHECCPQCGHPELETTTMGQILPPDATLDDIHDVNHVNCKCGWKGEVHDLIGKLRVTLQVTRDHIEYRQKVGGPIAYGEGLFDLEVVNITGDIPTDWLPGTSIELVLDEQA